MNTILELPYPPSELNPNRIRGHWAKRSKAVKGYRHAVHWLAKGKKPVMEFAVQFCPPNNNRRDVDNAIASFKAGIDGLADAWRVDDSQFLITFQRTFGPSVKNGSVLLYHMEARHHTDTIKEGR